MKKIGSRTYRIPYVRHLKYRIVHERIKHNWRSYYRREILRALDDSLKPPQTPTGNKLSGECLIEINNTCNLRCPMCSTHLGGREKKNMELETYRRVLARVKEAGINVVSIYTIGEPLVYPWLREALSVARDMGIGVVISTNANLPEKLRTLYETYPESLNRLLFSVDSATADTYERVRRGGKLGKVLESCEWVLKTNKNRHMSRIGLFITCALSKDNIKELATFMRLFSKYTFPECIRFILVNSLSPDQTFFDEDGLAFSDLYRLNVPCTMSVFQNLYINNEGELTLCCRDYDGQLVVGSILEQPISQVWQSPAARGIRAKHLGHEEMSIAQCKRCYFPKRCVSEMVSAFIHRLHYAADEFDDREWCERTLGFLGDLNSVLGGGAAREEKIAKVRSHL